MDAKGRKWGRETAWEGDFWQENRNGAGKQEGERSETTKNAKNAKNGSENAKIGSRTLKRGLHTV